MKRIVTVVAVLGLTVMTGGAFAQTPAGLGDLVGARAAGAEQAIQARGYTLAKAEKGDDRSYTYWWNSVRRQCVAVATMDGRYASIVSTPAADCGQHETRKPDSGYHPDIGYTGGTHPNREAPSYVEDRPRAQVGGQDIDLGLVCFGDGQRPGVATTSGWSWNSRTDRYDYGNRTEMTSQQFDASVMLQLWSGGGRIRLPRKLVPPINSRGQDGWWDLYEVSMGPEVIRAKYRLNGLNKPLVTINRQSGQISIQGTAPYAFRGTCDLIDGSDHRRF